MQPTNAPIRPKCLHCSLTFHSHFGLTRHCKRTHGVNEGNCACSQCNLEVNSLSQLRKHANSAHNQAVSGVSLNMALCGLCNCYRSVRNIWHHIQIIHLHVKSDVKMCPICGERMQKKELQAHCLLHHPSIPCYRCSAVFGSFTAYNSHFNDFHNLAARERKPALDIVCGLCLQRHCKLSSFAKHVFTVHFADSRDGEVCLYCWQVLPLVSLNEHINTQHEYIQCRICKETLTRLAYQQHLKVHLTAIAACTTV